MYQKSGFVLKPTLTVISTVDSDSCGNKQTAICGHFMTMATLSIVCNCLGHCGMAAHAFATNAFAEVQSMHTLSANELDLPRKSYLGISERQSGSGSHFW
jgi:hypothetical protein